MTPEHQALLRGWRPAPTLKKLVIALNRWLPAVPFACYPVAAGTAECPVVPAALRKPRRRSGFYAAHRPGSLCAGASSFWAARFCGPG